MAVLNEMSTTQYSPQRLSVHKLFTSYSTMPIVMCLRLSDVSIRQAAQQRSTWFTQYRTSDVAENLGSFLYGAYTQGNDFELILMVKKQTRHPIERSFGSDYPAICNSVIIV